VLGEEIVYPGLASIGEMRQVDEVRMGSAVLEPSPHPLGGTVHAGVLSRVRSELEHRGYEAAARCLSDDLDALVVHLRYPLRHRERWRSTNLLERSLGEVRRRTKVMGRFPGETSCLSLVWAVLDLFFSHASNGATFTDVDRQHLYRIKYQQADPDTLDEEVTAA
jgi:hypothetical protein